MVHSEAVVRLIYSGSLTGCGTASASWFSLQQGYCSAPTGSLLHDGTTCSFRFVRVRWYILTILTHYRLPVQLSHEGSLMRNGATSGARVRSSNRVQLCQRASLLYFGTTHMPRFALSNGTALARWLNLRLKVRLNHDVSLARGGATQHDWFTCRSRYCYGAMDRFRSMALIARDDSLYSSGTVWRLRLTSP
jgi:hypothetical protein